MNNPTANPPETDMVTGNPAYGELKKINGRLGDQTNVLMEISATLKSMDKTLKSVDGKLDRLISESLIG